jgi:hypothetical protein
MASLTTPTGGSPPRRALLQPALPVVLIKQSTGHGTCESSPARPPALRNATVVGTLSRANLSESMKTTSHNTGKSGKSYAPQWFCARLQLPIFQHPPFCGVCGVSNCYFAICESLFFMRNVDEPIMDILPLVAGLPRF